MRQDAFESLQWPTTMSDLDAVMSAGYSVSLATTWPGAVVTRLWIKTRLADGAPEAVSAAHLGATPALLPAANPAPEALLALNPIGVPGPWSERLPHIRHGAEPGAPGHVQTEYMLPRTRATEAIAMLRAVGPRIDEHLLVSAVRSVAGDTLWLSSSYGRDTICLHFSWKRHSDAVQHLTAEIEAMLLPLGGRPHWGRSSIRPPSDLRRSIRSCRSFANWFVRSIQAGSFGTRFWTRTSSDDAADSWHCSTQ
jgi:alditol oxidase